MSPQSQLKPTAQNASAPAPATLALIRLPEVLSRVGLSRSSWYAFIRDKKAPTPISLGGNSVAWVSSEIDSWILARIAASRGHVNAIGGGEQ